MSMKNETPNAEATPAKTDEQKKAARRERSKKLKAAKEAIRQFLVTEEVKALPKGIQAALALVAPAKKARSGGGGGGSNVKLLQSLFAKVGDAVSELDIFKQTKKGRGEFRKLTRSVLKKADPAERMWITFDEDAETWTLASIGESAPKGWEGIDPNQTK